MLAETVKKGDKVQLSEINHRYNYLLQEKFTLMDRVDYLKASGKPFSTLTTEMQKLTDELMRLDETRTQIALS